jgi:hypothetical protein
MVIISGKSLCFYIWLKVHINKIISINVIDHYTVWKTFSWMVRRIGFVADQFKLVHLENQWLDFVHMVVNARLPFRRNVFLSWVTINYRPLTSEDPVRSRFSPCRICGGQSGTGTFFSPSSSVLRCKYHPPWLFIWGMNNRPFGGRRSEI